MKFVKLLIASFSVFFVWFFVHTAHELSGAREKILESSNVIDVTDLISTKLLVTDANFPGEGKWTKKDFDDVSWTSTKIPSHQILQEKEYALGKYAYYRIKIPYAVLKKFKYLRNEISLALQYVLFSHVDIFIDGKLVKSTTPQLINEYLQIIPIPEITDGVIAIKGRMLKAFDTGIDHRGEILLGKTSEFNELFVAGFKRQTVFQLIFILCKGSILFIFALIFLILKVDSSFLKFFFFGICTMIEELIAGDYLNSLLQYRYQIYLYNFANIGTVIFVFLFFADLLGVKTKRKNLWGFVLTLTLISTFITADALHKNFYFNTDGWMKFWNLLTASVMSYYLPKMYRSNKILFVILSIVICFYLVGAAPLANAGLNFKRYGNLVLFIMVAYQTFIIFRREQDLLKMQEKQLLEQEKDVVIGKTANLLAHDIRKPLDQMKLVLDKISSGESDRNFIELAREDIDFSIKNVNRQIDDMMSYGKTSEIKLKPISFYKVLSHSIKQVMSIHQEMDLKLEYDFHADYKIFGDEARLSGVIVNLVSNAVEAIRDLGNKLTGEIIFSTETEKDEFRFNIFNDGPEIPSHLIDEIFKPFFTNGKPKGTGLGLASVAKAINDLQGCIKVRNIANRGVIFTVIFRVSSEKDSFNISSFHPLSKSYAYPISEQTKKSEALSYRVLILCNNDESLKEIISSISHSLSVTSTYDQKSAQENIHKMRYDLYLLSESLGGKDISKNDLGHLDTGVIVFKDIRDLPENLTSLIDTLKRPRILLADDTKLFQVAWQMFHGAHNIKCLSSPEEVIHLLENTNEIFDAYVFDFHFANSSLDGEYLARKVKSLRGSSKIFISSSVEQLASEFKNISKKDYDVLRYLR